MEIQNLLLLLLLLIFALVLIFVWKKTHFQTYCYHLKCTDLNWRKEAKIPLSMNMSTFLAYDQPTISYCGVHHELLGHKSYDSNAQEETMETPLETDLDLSTITRAARNQ